jgi:hypothetical protein
MNSDSELPKYKATRDLKPSPNARHRNETPFASQSDNDVWQYAERPIAAGAEISTDCWPSSSMQGMNDAARQILEFFRTRQRSRMPLKPIRNGRVYLDDGLSGPTQPNISIRAAAIRGVDMEGNAA